MRHLSSRPVRVAGGLIAALVAGALLALVFVDPIVSAFVLPRLVTSFAEAHTGYTLRITGLRCHLLANRVGCDSVMVFDDHGELAAQIVRLDVRGMDWWSLFREGPMAGPVWAAVVLDAGAAEVRDMHSGRDFRCGSVHLSVPDAGVRADSLAYGQSVSDNEFFAESPFRRTRIEASAIRGSISGAAWVEMLQGVRYHARVVLIEDAFVDVLCNKDKRAEPTSTPEPMPGDLMASLTGSLRVDSIIVRRATIRYGEQMTDGAEPATISLDSVDLAATVLVNGSAGESSLEARFRGIFMHGGTFLLAISMPVGAPELTFGYAGSLTTTDLRALNPFLETAEQLRITDGVLGNATFAITVVAGRASGAVRAVYRDLTLARIDKVTGSASGVGDRVTSFIANTFTIRRTNTPDASGRVRAGRVSYVRKPDDTFLRFIWFALRTGLKDIVGF